MALPISSAPMMLRPIVRTAAASEISPMPTAATAQEEHAPSVSEILSKRMKTMRQASRDMLSKLNTVSESRKAAARQKLELAKERIKMLKMLVASGFAPKGVLREIRALAQELGQAAKELSGDSPPTHSGESADSSQTVQESDAPQASVEGEVFANSNMPTDIELESEPEDALQADTITETELKKESARHTEVQEQVRSAQREVGSLGAYLNNQNNTNANQKRHDAESIKEVLSLLKSLVNMVKSIGLNDPESRKELEKINSMLSKTESIATEMSGGLLGGLTIGNIVSVTV